MYVFSVNPQTRKNCENSCNTKGLQTCEKKYINTLWEACISNQLYFLLQNWLSIMKYRCHKICTQNGIAWAHNDFFRAVFQQGQSQNHHKMHSNVPIRHVCSYIHGDQCQWCLFFIFDKFGCLSSINYFSSSLTMNTAFTSSYDATFRATLYQCDIHIIVSHENVSCDIAFRADVESAQLVFNWTLRTLFTWSEWVIGGPVRDDLPGGPSEPRPEIRTSHRAHVHIGGKGSRARRLSFETMVIETMYSLVSWVCVIIELYEF